MIERAIEPIATVYLEVNDVINNKKFDSERGITILTRKGGGENGLPL